MMKLREDATLLNNYPYISDELIYKLKQDFPNELPKNEVTPFELGRLIGQQQVIEKLTVEQQITEGKDFRDDLEF